MTGTPITVRGEKLHRLINTYDANHLVDLLPLPRLVEFAENQEFVSPHVEEYLRTDAPVSLDDGPVEHAEWTEIKETLAAAIEKLPEKERTVVALYYYDEMTLKEIAAILHLSEARISQLHTKAIFRMRGSLARMNDDL